MRTKRVKRRPIQGHQSESIRIIKLGNDMSSDDARIPAVNPEYFQARFALSSSLSQTPLQWRSGNAYLYSLSILFRWKVPFAPECLLLSALPDLMLVVRRPADCSRH